MQITIWLLHAAALASYTIASPLDASGGKHKSCVRHHDANYDDLATSKVALLNDIPTPYQGLAYKSFKSASDGLISTIAAHTKPNTVGFSLVTGVTEGHPTITRNYKDSSVKSFNMKSLWMSCVTINPTGIYLPVSCTVQAVGTKLNGKKVYGNISFKAPLIPKLKLLKKKTKQQQVTLPPSFKNLDSVLFQVVSAGVDANITNVAFDNIEYDTIVPC